MTDQPGANRLRIKGGFHGSSLLVGLMAAGLLLVGAPAFAQPPVNTTTARQPCAGPGGAQ
jgi:hypothetical protein